MISDLIAKMRARCAAATPDWRVEVEFCGSTMRPFLVRPERDGIQFGASVQDADDVTFAAYARTDLPRALDALEIAVKALQFIENMEAIEHADRKAYKALREAEAALKGEAK